MSKEEVKDGAQPERENEKGRELFLQADGEALHEWFLVLMGCVRRVPARHDLALRVAARALLKWYAQLVYHKHVRNTRDHGAQDRQVAPEQAPRLEAAFEAAGDTDATTRIFPNTDQEFMYNTVGDPDGYARLKVPHRMQPIVVGTVVECLVSRLKQDPSTARRLLPGRPLRRHEE